MVDTLSHMNEHRMLRRVRLLLVLFVIGLLISGATAIHLRAELNLLDKIAGEGTTIARLWPSLGSWITRVHDALREMGIRYPFLAYGYDWLAFGHFAIAVFFLGALRDPGRNRWIVEAGMIACILVVPYAIVMGQIRGIPIFWRAIDTLFGIIGIVPLWFVRRQLVEIEQARQAGAMNSRGHS
jgi:hypothetical protein